MFVKFKHWTVRKGKDGTIIYDDLKFEEQYEPLGYRLFPEKPEPPREDDIEMLFTLEFEKGDKTITFPAKTDDGVTEIFVTNAQGKTVDRYIY